jgi:E3 ubiquitin-protein ligase Arkadia
LDELQRASTNILSLDTGPFVQDPSSVAIARNINLNAGIVGSESFQLSSGSGGFVMPENDGSYGHPFEVHHRTSRKRNTLDSHVGSSSMDVSSRYLQHLAGSSWPTVPAHDAGSSIRISAPSEQANPRLVRQLQTVSRNPDSAATGSAENSHRNVRVRLNSMNQLESFPPTLFPTGNAARSSVVSSSQRSSRLVSFDHSLDHVRTAPMVDNMTTQSQPGLIHVPALPQNVQPFQWSDSRNLNSATTNIPAERVASREEGRSRGMTRNMLEHPMVVPVPELRNLTRNQAGRSLTGVNTSIPGSGTVTASISRTGSNSVVHPFSAPGWVPQPNSSLQHTQRFSELVRRSLLSAPGIDSVGEINDQSAVRSGSQEEMVFSSGSGNQRRYRGFPRSVSLMERQSDSVLGIPQSLRSLATRSEGRSRRLAVSEIRNMLDLMRRREGLRFEDVMLLDQSVYFGVADFHDRHRDMRLDVDNMSYEELLALEERIGNVSTGLSEETISSRLKMKKRSIVQGAEPCCVCQEEYNDGEDVGVLECGHEFHTKCIKEWLMQKNVCPICKEAALPT